MDRVFVIAEISANHSQNYDKSVELVKVAKEVGADAVKLQTYTPDTMTLKCDRPEFKIKGGTPWDGETLYELYKKAYMHWEWQPKLKKLADEIGIELFSTAYDKTSVDFLESMNVSRYKIASFELVDIPLIKYVASKNKPIILSTGMASIDEIREAVEAIDNNSTTLLKCISAYPAKISEMNLVTLPYLAKIFRLQVGLSDHSLSTIIPISAVSLGALVIEKHITLSRNDKSFDSAFSLEPKEFKEMVDGIRITELALGKRKFGVAQQELSSKVFRRSLFAIKDIRANETLDETNVKSIRPGFGLEPKYLNGIIGLKALMDIERGTPLRWDLFKL
jgi:pseudaminic acid synthase